MFYVPVLESKSDLVPALMIMVVLLSERLSQGIEEQCCLYISRWKVRRQVWKCKTRHWRRIVQPERGRYFGAWEECSIIWKSTAEAQPVGIGKDFQKIWNRGNWALLVIVRYTKYLWSARRSLTKFLHPNFLCSDLRNIILGKDILTHAAAAAKLLQSCPTLCDPTDSSPTGSPVPGILQARTLEWVAISFSNAQKWKVKVNSLSCVKLVATPSTAAYQAPPSMGFSRQEY